MWHSLTAQGVKDGVIRDIERSLGKVYLPRLLAGVETPLSWIEYHDLVGGLVLDDYA